MVGLPFPLAENLCDTLHFFGGLIFFLLKKGLLLSGDD